MKHYYTETTEINYSKLEERLLQINNSNLIADINLNGFLSNVPTLIMATGGSKPAAYYLEILLEKNGTLCEVIEPRDYFYKTNIDSFKRLIVISNSGNSNGVMDALNNFLGDSILITGDYQEQLEKDNFKVIKWSNESYLGNKESSFISLVSTLAPMLMFLELDTLLKEGKKDLSQSDYEKINDKLKLLLKKSKDQIDKLDFSFKDTNLVQILSGYDTRVSSSVLESNMIETGAVSIVVHDKGAFCHGRSNLIFQNPESPIIYLAHNMKKLDDEMLDVLKKEYPNIFLINSFDEEDNLWKEFYLVLQMYYLSRKIAEDKKIDLTMPEYNSQVVKKLYKYRGEM